MQSEVPTAGADQDRGRTVEELERELAEALEQKTAINEILGVISSSPTDIQPVFDNIIASAVRLCDARQGAVYRFDGELVHLGAHHNYPPEILEILCQMYPRPPQPDQVSGRAILTRAGAQIEDMLADPLFPRELTLAGGWGSHVAVPMLRDGVPIGAIVIARVEAGPFSARHVELLKSFADQAVIAINNVRFFEEVQARTRELTTSLEYQTATSEVLGVISRSQTDVERVFGAILDCAVRFCGADQGTICRVRDGQLDLIEYHPSTPEVWAVIRENYPRPVDTTSLTGRAVVEARIVHVPDIEAPTAPASLSGVVRGLGFRSQLSVPLLRSGQPIGVLALQRQAPGPYSPAQIALVETFADQAVIAIENTRLIEEVHEKNQALTEANTQLTEALEQQTATSEILRVISSSPTDVQPVLRNMTSLGRSAEATIGRCSVSLYCAKESRLASSC